LNVFADFEQLKEEYEEFRDCLIKVNDKKEKKLW